MRWIFALLTRIDLFCLADEMACLRNLARACLSLNFSCPFAEIREPNSLLRTTEQAEYNHGNGYQCGRTARLLQDSGGDHKTLSDANVVRILCRDKHLGTAGFVG